ncbi:glucosaminidase domain-containing protein [Polaribacter ponticola]|uniref:Peptidoglycan hydrolase n=1 Tax=Polaribacter ponticola TaxID=2978475 RepID=A0ABT5SA63_9FLAO|nr:glucosaminidase domain-containing protein [Polaribacter sp. MSW5]MDD7915011.1 glucosaminidase domain-containing protein [Polaribacter sp. MSW5]
MKVRILISFVLVLFLASCASSRNARKQKKNPGVVQVEAIPVKLSSVNELKHVKILERSNKKLSKNTLKYIKNYASIAVKEMHLHKIPASITLAQGVLESGSGRSDLASKSNNHFGIKCHTKWKGERVYHDDDARGECFRKYKYVETSYHDHSEFLTKRKRYNFLFTYGSKDYKKWAKGLRKAGYATDKKYPNKLIKIIEDYRLYEFDKVKKKGFKYTKPKEVKKRNKNFSNKFYKVKKGDTLYSISRKFNISVQKLKQINSLQNNTISIGKVLKTQ